MSLQDRSRFEPAEVEPRITEAWTASGLVHPEPEGTAAENYSIAIPPPNVTGALHMGHALNGSIQDTLVRWNRMHGRRTKWILGTDHAGIATQTQVEKLLRTEGSSREAIGREAFTERVWQWRGQYGGTIVEQLRRLGASCDFEAERFTLDEQYAQAVLEVFVRLYDKNLIYRDNYMVNWDPGSRSAISDLEVEDREVTDTLYSIAYPLSDASGEAVVATVRPETMLADTAVAVHPDDERYAHLIGRTVTLPLVGRPLRIIADDYVKTDFGTGCLKITPGHDPNDFEIGRRHGLEEISILGEDGRMTAAAGAAYAGVSVEEARERVVTALREQGLMRAEDPYTHTVPFSHRSGSRIEPLVSLQWFMRMDELAAPARQVVHDGRVRIHPDSQRRRYDDWLANIRPWCVSRQLWWGHQIPVWYRGAETFVGSSAPEGVGWERDPDVLDTWFSSALWPFATLGWPHDTQEMKAFYPTDVLSTARDILFLWVARMVMMALELTGDVPFRDVYIHSVIQAPDGRRMSKSLGTGVDPLALIEGGPRPSVYAKGSAEAGEFPAYGADAVRFGMLAMSSTQDVRFNEEKVAQGQALGNKLFNATRFVLGKVPAGTVAAPRPTAVEDRWILSRLEAVKAHSAQRIMEYDFSKLALGLYDYVYGELCDWYLEMIKGREIDEDLAATLLHVLRESIALVHPVMPFVTEDLWGNLPGHDGTLLAASRLPDAAAELRAPAAEQQVATLIAAITAVRSWRNEAGVPPGARLDARLSADSFPKTSALLARLARLSLSDDAGATSAATITVPGGTVQILASGAFDPAEARRKAQKQLATLDQEIARAEAKLARAGFTERAPQAVVQAERDKLERLQIERGRLQDAP